MKREEEGIAQEISSSTITGHFISVDVPQVTPGKDIKATVSFYAINPGAWYWKTFLILTTYQLTPNDRLLDATREIGQEAGRTKTYNLGPMPNKNVALSFFLFAHDDAGYDWDWNYYYAWLNGFPIEVQYLGSAYRLISPGEVPVDLKVLEYEILGEKQGGSIDFQPDPLDAQGHYEKGTVVSLTAIVNPSFAFVKWRGEVDNPLSTSLVNTVTMSENRLVKAEFALEKEEKLWPLEVDIEPTKGGYVTTIPAPVDINNFFTDGTIGKFIENIRVKVTAYPNAGYEFWKWSDEIQGGVSYNPTEWVSGVMDEKKTVKAHFRKIEIPPECAIDADCPEGYICVNGVCVPEEEVPPEEVPPEKAEFPWVPVTLVAGGLAVAVAATRKSKKP